MRIVHITTHMGGGAGNAIANMIRTSQANQHKLICLQIGQKRQYIEKCAETGMEIWEEPENHIIQQVIEWADVVVIHWWHHPLMCRFLAEFPAHPVRMVLWVHISGCSYPVLQFAFADLFDCIFFTTPFSYDNREWGEEERKRIRQKSDIVYGLGDMSCIRQKQDYRQLAGRFTIGYIGTFAKAKLHPKFLDFCGEIIKRVPEVNFLMVGDLNDSEWLMQEIERHQLEAFFCFTGYCTDISVKLNEMDIFAYPLNPKHFGTTENVILEAMFAGLPVVLLEQSTEKYIVTNKKDGFLVRSKEEYGEAVWDLYRSRRLREHIGKAARETILRKYNAEKNCQVFEKGIQNVLRNEKHLFECVSICGSQPSEWLRYGMDRKTRSWFENWVNSRQREIEKAEECPEILLGKSKSSIEQFYELYPEDSMLKYLYGIRKER